MSNGLCYSPIMDNEIPKRRGRTPKIASEPSTAELAQESASKDIRVRNLTREMLAATLGEEEAAKRVL